MIKATLSNLTIYSLFKIHKGGAVKIERLQNHFLWRGQETSKPHLVKWEISLLGKEIRRLDLGGLVNRDQAFIGQVVMEVPP